MTISLVKGRHAAECPCRICQIAREVIFRVEESRFLEAPEQPTSFAAERRQERLRIPHQRGAE